MATYNASNASVLVFTFKEGLLSRVAHDLQLSVRDFTIELDESSFAVQAAVDPASLRVVCCMKRGVEAPGTLSAGDKQKVIEYTNKDVLHPRQHRTIGFRSTSVHKAGDGFVVDGILSLHGVHKAISTRVTRAGGGYTTSFDINQPDYGIEPFSAMFGAMKVKPVVRVKVTVPAS